MTKGGAAKNLLLGKTCDVCLHRYGGAISCILKGRISKEGTCGKWAISSKYKKDLKHMLQLRFSKAIISKKLYDGYNGLFVDGKYCGAFDVMEEDINLFCQLDSFEGICDMVEATIERR